jgi:hypothetical protein
MSRVSVKFSCPYVEVIGGDGKPVCANREAWQVSGEVVDHGGVAISVDGAAAVCGTCGNPGVATPTGKYREAMVLVRSPSE